jgi:DNA primase
LVEDRVALIKQVKAANDIVEVVGTYVALRPVGPTFKGLCPFHEDHRPSFDVDPRRQRYRCWSCGKYGDVLTFVQEHERISFNEAMELLGRRAGISLEKRGDFQQSRSRALMLDVVRWGAEQFQHCLLDDTAAEAARQYLGERKLNGETVRRFGLGYAPSAGDWLVERAARAGMATEWLEKVGLIARRQEGNGYYDRFRERVMFPIRNVSGQTVGFGGRILPSSPLSARAPKYYNSTDTLLFSKSELLYGLDQARKAAATAGYVAVVEGYTDVLMAHQMGVAHVVATMGTALNARHVRQLKRCVPSGKVVLVFDADAGGDTGVDRALEVFVSHDLDLKIATLPPGLDPCDLLVQQGADGFQTVLTKAADVLEFKLIRMLSGEVDQGVEGQRRALDEMLRIIALAPPLPEKESAVKRELMVNRIAHRLGIQEGTAWTRLRDLQAARRHTERGPEPQTLPDAAPGEQRPAPAAPVEVELMQVLLADPALVKEAADSELAPAQVKHPGIRLLLEGLYRLQAEGQPPVLDLLRPRIENPRLIAKALEWQDIGRQHADRTTWLKNILARLHEQRSLPGKQELQNQLHAASDHQTALGLLRQLQNHGERMKDEG